MYDCSTRIGYTYLVFPLSRVVRTKRGPRKRENYNGGDFENETEYCGLLDMHIPIHICIYIHIFTIFEEMELGLDAH